METLCQESLAVCGHDHGGERMGTLEFIPAGWPDRRIGCKGSDIPSQIHSTPLAWPAWNQAWVWAHMLHRASNRYGGKSYILILLISIPEFPEQVVTYGKVKCRLTKTKRRFVEE